MENNFTETQTEITPESYNRAIRDLTHLTLRLKQLDKAKDEFISIASHELRNPMAIIKGTISMILAGDDGEINSDVREDLKDTLVVVERQIRLVNELLDVSRIEAGVIFFNLQAKINLVDLAKLLAESLNAVSRKNKIKIIVEDPGEIQTVQGDQDRISQVLINLVTNALKFTNEGSIQVSFSSKNNFIETRVADTGAGMEKEAQKQLFKKFTKPGDPTVGTMSSGSGLGLYISQKYIEHLGGSLYLEKSELGKGSTFCFTLPITGTQEAAKIAAQIEQLQSLKKVHYKNTKGDE